MGADDGDRYGAEVAVREREFVFEDVSERDVHDQGNKRAA